MNSSTPTYARAYFFALSFASGAFLNMACKYSERFDSNYCQRNDGDRYCKRKHPDAKTHLWYCERGSCKNETDLDDGCLPAIPEEKDQCYSPCGWDVPWQECNSSSTTDMSTGTETGTSTEPTETSTETTGTSETTTGEECGNGEKEGMEECDDGDDVDDNACTNACTLPMCGDEIVQMGEDCEDKNEVNTDECVEGCKMASCGDGFVWEGEEVCDDKMNDGSYGGCMPGCESLGPRCGDGMLQMEEGEECDGDMDGECLSTCKRARNCQEHIEDGAVESGTYMLGRQGMDMEFHTFEVHCEIEEGLGYTYLKVDLEKNGNFPAPASGAEAICQKYGLQLFIPRDEAHVARSYEVATTMNVTPVDADNLPNNAMPMSPEYLKILGVYPKEKGKTCMAGKALNSQDCPEWQASDVADEGLYWLSNTEFMNQSILTSTNCLTCSMDYTWVEPGILEKANGIDNPGAASHRFMCDTPWSEWAS